MYFNLWPAACVCVCEEGYECAFPTSVLTASDVTVISMHGSEQTPTYPKHNVSVVE
jgi:hypothetical protein